MDNLYDGLPDSGLMYLNQSVEESNKDAMSMLAFTTSGFNSFKNTLNSQNNAKADSAFSSVTVQSAYSKAVHSNNLTYTHYNVSYYNVEEPEQISISDELNKLNDYLLSTNQEIPKSLSAMIEAQAKKSVNANQHQNVIVEESNPYEIIVEDGVSLFAGKREARGYGYYSEHYDGSGNTETWYRHGNWDKETYTPYSQRYDDHYDHYDDHDDYYDYYDYSDYSQHYNYNKSVPHGYSKQVMTTKTKKQFVPTKPSIFNSGDLSDMQNTVTLGYYSYDRNNAKSGESAWGQVKYKVELRKTSGPNQRSWTTIQDSTAETVKINPIDPFGLGWSKTTQGYGDYQLRITPYNPVATINASDGWSYTSSAKYGTAVTFTFHIAVNTQPTLEAGKSTPALNATLFMDGAIKNGKEYNYNNFYGSGVPSSINHGIYLDITVTDPDVGQYLKGYVLLKNRSTGATVLSSPIVWSNGQNFIQSSGSAVTGYCFINSTSLKNQEFDSQLEVVLSDYYEIPVGSTIVANSTLKQNKISASNSTLLNVSLNMKKTLNYDSVKVIPNTDITQKPVIEIAVNQQEHIKNSFSEIKYAWTQSTTMPTAWFSKYSRNVSLSPTSEGIWYLHQRIIDKYGNSLYNMTGPVYYSPTQVVLNTPTITHFDNTDKVKITATMKNKPGIGLTYQYRYGYRKKGSTGAYTYSAWQSSNVFTSVPLKIYDGVEVITQAKIVELGQVITSPIQTITVADKLAWCIKNQSASNYNLESTSSPIYNKHGSDGTISGGYKLVATNSELDATLRENEYFYYKFGTDGKYYFKKIIYFTDPLS